MGRGCGRGVRTILPAPKEPEVKQFLNEIEDYLEVSVEMVVS